MKDFIKDLFTRDFVKNVFHSLISKGILISLSLIISIIITRTLGPELKGEYFLIISIIGIVSQITNLGLHSVNVHYTAKHPELRNHIFGNSLIYGLIAGIIGAGLFLLFGKVLVPDIWKYDFIPFVLVTGIPLSLMRLFFRQIIIGTQNIKLHNKIEIIGVIIYLFMVLAAYFANMVSFKEFIILLILENFFSVLILFIAIYGKQRIKLSFSKTTFKKTLPYGIKAYVITLLAYLVIRSDVFLINYFIPDLKELGYYSTAVQITDKFALVGTIIASVLMPRLSSDDKDEQKLYLQEKTNKYAILILLVVMIPVLILSKQILVLLFGEAFAPASIYLQLLLIATFFLSIESIMAQFLASIGIPLKLVYYWALALVLNITLNILLIPTVGTIGAAYSSIFSYLLMFILVLRLTQKYKIHYEKN